jgi:RNA polymerase sigma factor (sigma-70 family)
LNDFRTFPIESLLRRVAVARRNGDVLAAKPEWDACVIRMTPRVRAAVKAFRTVHGDRVASHDHEVVVNDALERACRRMIHTLDSLDERSFKAAITTCAYNACHDHFRRLGQQLKGIAGSLDEPAFDDGEGNRFDGDLAREAELRQADDEAAFDAGHRIESAIQHMKHDRRRKAVELRELGLEYEEVADALGTSVQNAQQLYSRGLKDMRGLMES